MRKYETRSACMAVSYLIFVFIFCHRDRKDHVFLPSNRRCTLAIFNTWRCYGLTTDDKQKVENNKNGRKGWRERKILSLFPAGVPLCISRCRLSIVKASAVHNRALAFACRSHAPGCFPVRACTGRISNEQTGLTSELSLHIWSCYKSKLRTHKQRRIDVFLFLFFLYSSIIFVSRETYVAFDCGPRL